MTTIINGPGHAWPGTWHSMDMFPTDGTKVNLLCRVGNDSVLVKNQYWGPDDHGKGAGIRGEKNFLTRALVPVCWKKAEH